MPEENNQIQPYNQESEELATFDDQETELNLDEIKDPQLLQTLKERQNKTLVDYSAHRKIYPNSMNGEKIVWDTPFMRKEEGQEFAEFPTISRKSYGASDIIGVVGIVTSADFGFAYWGDDQESNSGGPKCKTVAAYTRYGDQEKLVTSNLPLKTPYRQPHQSKKEPSKFNKDLRRKKSYLTLYGSRAPLDEEGKETETGYDPSEPITLDNVDQRFRTCEQCVHFKDHFDLEDEHGQVSRKASKCGFNGEIKVAVFAIAVEETDIKGNKDVVFYRPEDYGIDTLTGPFIARMLLNKTAGLQQIGEGDFEIQVNKKSNPLAEGIYDFPTYYDLLQSSLSRIDLYEDGTKPVYNFLTVITPIEVKKSDPKAGGADYIPVFKHLKGGHFDHCLKSEKVSQIAYDLEKAEIRSANNEAVYIPTANPVFDALEKEGLNCYRPDASDGEEPPEDGSGETPDNPDNGDGGNGNENGNGNSKPNPFSSYKFKRTAVGS